MWRRQTTALGVSVLVTLLCLPLSGEQPAGLQQNEPYGRHQFEEYTRDHWAFKPVERPAVPQPAESAWVRTPIDAFVLASLKEAGLKPAPPANRTDLLRRVYIDLIGLLPTPAEVDAFLADDSPLAFERVVDDLLARPQYGERWARHWLDVVRYGETNGYERDGAKPEAWKFRDWVIASLNADKPYDRFLTEQLAGDEVADANADTQVATTMLRLGPWDDEPADPLTDRYDQLDDIVGVTSATFLGLTLRCARCHDHKFEPLTQKDYTRWLSVFAPLKRPQEARTELTRDLGPVPVVAAQHALVKQLDAEKLQAEDEKRLLAWQVLKRAESDGRLTIEPRATVLAATSQAEGQSWRYTFDAPVNNDWLLPDFHDAGWKLGIGGFGTHGTAGATVRTEWNTTGIWLRREFILPTPPQGRVRLLIQHDEDVEVYLNGVPAASFKGFVAAYRDVAVAPAARQTLRPGRNVLAVHCRHGAGGQAIDVGLAAYSDDEASALLTKEVPREAIQAALVEPAKRNDAEKKLLQSNLEKLGKLIRGLAVSEQLAGLDAADQKIGGVQARYPAPLPAGYIWYEEGPTAPALQVFERGDPRTPTAEVLPGVPAILVDTPPPAPTPTAHSTGRRLELARWLTAKNNPLTARVMVNRLWQHHFGEGLVATENDFGVMGSAPSHQGLLDWLASEFVAGGWQIKRMHRLMVLSQTYQMSSAPNAEAERKDPQGALLWRFRPRRMEAEALRDAILTVSGQLNPAAQGPSVFPKISRAVLETQSQPGNGWAESAPGQAARRSVYVFVKRTLILPELDVLDFPSSEESCEQRIVSTVAPQALTLLNGEFIHEQALALAQRLVRESGSDLQSRVERAYRLAFSRLPNDAERAAVSEFLNKQKQQIATDVQPVPPEAEIELKALTALCLVLLNTNEFAYLK